MQDSSNLLSVSSILCRGYRIFAFRESVMCGDIEWWHSCSVYDAELMDSTHSLKSSLCVELVQTFHMLCHQWRFDFRCTTWDLLQLQRGCKLITVYLLYPEITCSLSICVPPFFENYFWPDRFHHFWNCNLYNESKYLLALQFSKKMSSNYCTKSAICALLRQ